MKSDTQNKRIKIKTLSNQEHLLLSVLDDARLKLNKNAFACLKVEVGRIDFNGELKLVFEVLDEKAKNNHQSSSLVLKCFENNKEKK